ncbi:MAG: hypothetical protein JO264_09900 [Acidisphaera sp.]|nr:hypothetical protein [Acidisphaera sp.]
MMKALALVSALALALGVGLAPSPGRAANADQPYSNVDHRNDAGNNTGDSQVDRLNSGQLDANQHPGQSGSAAASAGGAATGTPAPKQ